MTRSLSRAVVISAASTLLCAGSAHAEGFFSPWVGVNWGSDIANGRAAFGINTGGIGRVAGAELSFGYSPSFFGTENDFGHNTVIDLMGNVIFGIPLGGTPSSGTRLFVTGGVGLLRTQIDGGTIATVSSSNNEFGWNVGAGVMGYFSNHVGLRGELKYVRGFEDLSTGNTVIDLNGNNQLHFWRAAFGVVFR
jgi:opacity protein-like surface antigen